jgi:hypothetical protein
MYKDLYYIKIFLALLIILFFSYYKVYSFSLLTKKTLVIIKCILLVFWLKKTLVTIKYILLLISRIISVKLKPKSYSIT